MTIEGVCSCSAFEAPLSTPSSPEGLPQPSSVPEPWARLRWRLILAGLAPAAVISIWNPSLNLANATGFDVDRPILSLNSRTPAAGFPPSRSRRWFLALPSEQREPAGQGVGAAANAGFCGHIV